MPRTRFIKPDFFDDENIAELSHECRLLYIGLWCLADKRGRLEDRPIWIKTKLFPYEKLDMEKCLDTLSRPKKHSKKGKPFIIRYEVDGEKYIWILAFLEHQRPHHTEKESIIPSYNGELTVKQPLDNSEHGDEHLLVISNSNQESEDVISKEFDDFWSAYPIHINKKDAFKAYKALRGKVPVGEISAALEGYCAFLRHQHTNEGFAQQPMYPGTWLRSDRWKEYAGFVYKPKM